MITGTRRCATCDREIRFTGWFTGRRWYCPEHRPWIPEWVPTTETTETRPAATAPFALTGDTPPQHTRGCLCFLSSGGCRPHLAHLADGTRLIVRREPGSTGGAWLELFPARPTDPDAGREVD